MNAREVVELASRTQNIVFGYSGIFGGSCGDFEWTPRMTTAQLDSLATRLKVCRDFTLTFGTTSARFFIDVSLDTDGRVKSVSPLRHVMN
jgi:hypothetical protein